MYFDSVQAAMLMDGHGVYVWPAYTVTLLVLVALLVMPRLRQKSFLRELRGEIRRAQQRAEQHAQKNMQQDNVSQSVEN